MHPTIIKKIDRNPGKTLLNKIEYLIEKEINLA